MNEFMSFENVVKVLNEGKKITNEYFTDNEFIHLNCGRFEFENGREVPQDWFNNKTFLKINWCVKE
jgi:hypothetical protein